VRGFWANLRGQGEQKKGKEEKKKKREIKGELGFAPKKKGKKQMKQQVTRGPLKKASALTSNLRLQNAFVKRGGGKREIHKKGIW